MVRADPLVPDSQSSSWALPQPVLMGAPAHAIRVKIGDVSFPKPGGASKHAGLADMRVELDCAEVGGTEIAPEPGAMYFPLPLFGPNKAEPDVFLELWVGGAQVIVDLTTKRSGFGALRAIVFAVEEVAEAHRLGGWGARPA